MFTRILVLFCFFKTAPSAGGVKPPDAIIYPGPVKEVFENRYGTEDEFPEECRGQTYCSVKPENYPEEKYNKMFAHMKDVPQLTLLLSDLDDRISDPNEKDGCSSITMYEPLYQVIDSKGRLRKVVQAPAVNYLQQVRIEKCNPKVKRCFMEYPPVPGITTACRQKTVKWEFVVDDEKGGTEKVSTELPICCACMYKIDN